MKKFTLSILIAVFLPGLLISQSFIHVAAPVGNGSSILAGPNGTNYDTYQRTVQLITAQEMAVLTASSISSIGFPLEFGTSTTPFTGTINVYLENTTDIGNTKSATWTSAIAGMTNVYSGTMTVPVSSGAATITLPLGAPFNYTGGGLYVAWDWVSTGPFEPSFLTSAGFLTDFGFNNLSMVMSAYSTSLVPVTLQSDFERHTIIFDAANTASTEIGIISLDGPGKMPMLASGGQVFSARVKNSGTMSATGFSVSLDIANGNSTYSDVKVVNNLAPGAITTVTFTPFVPTVQGVNTFSVWVNSDANLLNNSKTWTTSVTCDMLSNSPPLAATNFYNGELGAGIDRIVTTKIKAPAGSSLTAVRAVIGSSTDTFGKKLYGVILDATGNILATSVNTITASQQTSLTFATFSFYPPVNLTADAIYYIGAFSPANGYPFGAWADNTYTTSGFYQAYNADNVTVFYEFPAVGGLPQQVPIQTSYLGLDAVLGFSQAALTVAASRTLICLNEPAGSVTLTASGGSHYTWSSSPLGSPTIAVTPTVTTGTGLVSYTVNGEHAASGCKALKATVTVSVDACTGLMNPELAESINVMPNPLANGMCRVSGLQGKNEIKLFDLSGKMFEKWEADEDMIVLDFSSYAQGVYFLKITNEQGQYKLVKVINQNQE